MIRHQHLKTLIEDILLNSNVLSEDYSLRLINELRYSGLIIPAKRSDSKLNFIIYETDDLKYTPLFTDRDEFKKIFPQDDVEGLENTFELYQNILKTKDIDGYILNPQTLNYILDRELILSIIPPKLNTFTASPYDEEELKEIFNSLDNTPLEEFIANPLNTTDWEGLFEVFSSSIPLALMLASSDLSSLENNGVISMREKDPLAFMHIDRIGGKYATIFSSKEKILKVSCDSRLFRYGQLINLSTLVNYVLCEDMDGIILNPETDNVLIPRGELLKHSRGFEKFCSNPRLCNAIFYLFSIE